MNEGDAPPVPKSIPDQFHFTRYTSNPYIRCTIPSPPRRPHQPSPPLPIFIDRFPSEAINWLHRNCSGFFCSELPARLGRRFPQAGGSEARPVRILQPARVRALAAPGCFLQIDSMGGLLAMASGLRSTACCSWPQLSYLGDRMYALIASAVSPARLRRGMRLFLSAFVLSLLGGACSLKPIALPSTIAAAHKWELSVGM